MVLAGNRDFCPGICEENGITFGHSRRNRFPIITDGTISDSTNDPFAGHLLRLWSTTLPVVIVRYCLKQYSVIKQVNVHGLYSSVWFGCTDAGAYFSSKHGNASHACKLR